MIVTGPSNCKISAWRKLSAAAGILVVAVSTLGVLATALDSHGVSQQETSPRPAFAVASVKSDKSQGNMDMGGANEKFHALRISLEGLIEYAYGVNHNEIVGPAWLRSETYDIEAKPEHRVNNALIRQMLQTLLTDRFKLAVHRQTKQLSVYALVVARNGPRLREAPPDEEPSFRRTPGHIVAKNEPLSALIQAVRGDFFSPGLLDRPVIEMTGLKGHYDFTLDWAQHDTDNGPSLFTALQEQLGVRLAVQNGAVEILVIDHAEKIPTEN